MIASVDAESPGLQQCLHPRVGANAAVNDDLLRAFAVFTYPPRLLGARRTRGYYTDAHRREASVMV